MSGELAAGMSQTPTRDPEQGSEAVLALLPVAVLVCALVAFVTAATAGARAGGAPGPTVTTGPAVEGQPTQGSRLRVSPGAWTGSGRIRFGYQWYRCDTM